MKGVARLWHRLRQSIVTRARLRRLITSADLRPGRYRPRGALLVNERFSVPKHLDRGKGAPEPIRTTPAGYPGMMLRLFRTGIEALFGYLIMTNRSPTDEGASIVLRKGSGAVLFAPDEGWVRRVAQAPIFTPEFVLLRERMYRHLPSKPFRVTDGGRVLTDGWVDGQALRYMTTEARVAANRLLLDAYVKLTAAEGCGCSSEMIDSARLHFEGKGHFAELLRTVRDPAFARCFATGPLTPQHGEPGAHNVIVSQDGPCIIDWEPKSVGLRPFWSDACFLISFDRWQPFLAGAYDRQLTRLWQAAGVPPPDLLQHRHHVAAAVVLSYAMRYWSAHPATATGIHWLPFFTDESRVQPLASYWPGEREQKAATKWENWQAALATVT